MKDEVCDTRSDAKKQAFKQVKAQGRDTEAEGKRWKGRRPRGGKRDTLD